MQTTLGNMNERINEKLDTIDKKVDTLDGKVTYTNGKVRKIILAIVLLAGIVIGQSFGNTKELITLIASAL